VVKALRDRELEQAREMQELGAGWTDTGLVFTRCDGTAPHPARITGQFTDLNHEAGLPPIRLHDLRHGTATHLLTAGIEMKVVSEILGHSSTAITADLYTSVVDELKQTAANAIADVFDKPDRNRGD
jgi:integrase